MILHALTVSNWRNVGHLELADLGQPLVILYGPNRTGKSSLVAALRSGLLDDDHDSSKAALKDSIPWHTRATPEVTIEFETAGQRYRVMKRFSKLKDGTALLERQRGESGPWDVLFRDKEAGREVRKILGREQSDDGLNQMLWVDQGETKLPEEKKLKLSLQKQFEEVLGALLTGRDWDFYNRLKRDCEPYFTPNMGPKKNSPVMEAEARLKSAQDTVQELRRKHDQSDSQRAEYERTRDDIAEAEQRVHDSRQELVLLQAAQEASRERRREHAQARTSLDVAKKELAAATDRHAAFQSAVKRLSDAQIAEVKAQATFDAAAADCELARAAAEETRSACAQAKSAIDAHEATRGELEDRRRLVELARAGADVVQKLGKCTELTKALDELNGQLAQLIAPTKKELGTLRTARDKCGELRAELAAGALQVTIRPNDAATVQASIDSAPPDAIKLAAGQECIRQFRQRTVLEIAQFGMIEVRRGREDAKLDDVARELSDVEQKFHDGVRRYGLAPDADDVLDELEERRSLYAQWTADVKHRSAELAELVPDGRGSLEAEQALCDAERAAILERRPALADWTPDSDEFAGQLRDFDQQLKRLKKTLSDADDLFDAKEKTAKAADKRLQTASVDVATAHKTTSLAEEDIKRHGDLHSLQAACETATQAVATAEARVAETALTPDEETIDQRLASATAAFETREKRLKDHERRAHEVHVALRSLQGLHEELTAAEAEFEQVEREFNERRLDADSHKLLRELFESCRDEQVRRTTSAVGTRVLTWAKQLGLDEYEQVEFESGYLPTALRRGDAEPVALATESFGTSEQLALLARLAVGGLLAKGERQTAILDDPLTHADRHKHRRMLEILQAAVAGSPPLGDGQPAAGPLQILIFTCHPERFDHLVGAKFFNLEQLIRR